mmetsp:Transcript_24371/g.41941  ORF Transcript_24371/g.41941 Transcript_24371/m.41941 type:complete len:80 (+) Transcript_24371:112-351(+)
MRQHLRLVHQALDSSPLVVTNAGAYFERIAALCVAAAAFQALCRPSSPAPPKVPALSGSPVECPTKPAWACEFTPACFS